MSTSVWSRLSEWMRAIVRPSDLKERVSGFRASDLHDAVTAAQCAQRPKPAPLRQLRTADPGLIIHPSITSIYSFFSPITRSLSPIHSVSLPDPLGLSPHLSATANMPPVRHNRPLTNAKNHQKGLFRSKQSRKVKRYENYIVETSEEAASKHQAVIAARAFKPSFGLTICQGDGVYVDPKASTVPANSCHYCWFVLSQFSEREEDHMHCQLCIDTVCL